MKAFFLLVVSLFVHFTIEAFTARAQSGSAAVQPPVGQLVVVYFTEKTYRLFGADFDTDGQSIGGLAEADLNKQFARTNSTAKVLNFVVQNGYRLVSFMPIDGETFEGRGDGFGGYTALFERVK